MKRTGVSCPSWSRSCQPAARIPAQPLEAPGGRAPGKNVDVDAVHGTEEGEVPSLPTPPA